MSKRVLHFGNPQACWQNSHGAFARFLKARNSPDGRSYANQVMTRVKNIQENIDFLANT